MAKTKDKLYDTAANVKPYVERAMTDEKLREDVLSAFTTARGLYNELIGGRNAVTLASRVASDEEIRDRLKGAIDDLRNASVRLQGKQSKGGVSPKLLIAGLALAILFNPVTGPGTRRWIKDLVTGGSDEFGGDYPSSGNSGSSGPV
jgi:hypothetical protein